MRAYWQQLIAGVQTWPSDVDVHTAQADWLAACLRRNADCAYGHSHSFARIRTVEDFRRYVPLSDYPSLAPWIERMAQGEADVLFAGRPVAFERTSGSSGASKLLPYSAASLADFSRALLPWLDTVVRRYQFRGSAYWAISPAMRQAQCTSGGTPIGLSDAAYLGEERIPAFMALSAVPFAVGTIGELGSWQRQTWHALLRRDDLELISVWSPTFLLALLDALPLHAQALTAQLREVGDDAAVQRLHGYLASGDGRALWPRLRLVSCWRDGASQTYFSALRHRLPQADFQPKGLLATEGVVTVPDAQDAPVLAAHSGFFEFRDAGGQLHMAHELVQGACYEVVMTTAGGLYRYCTGDHVRCRPVADGWPALDFLGRGGLLSDLVGEKLSEAFVADCLPMDGGFRMLIAQLDPAPHYLLIADAAAPSCDILTVEQRLLRNPQYRYARELGQLQPLQVRLVPQPLQAYLRRMARGGTRLGDIKPVALRAEPDWLSTFCETSEP